ncbi:MAG: DUF1638 domain-containing protein [Deltaproteobacteria bacterium]|nr:DUF1638 domain-containing protein [Deltaproteobacteria bacterium]MBN2670314.1 DUF1638 domain-containing protein [Deltaproteobacteria bacterium]
MNHSRATRMISCSILKKEVLHVLKRREGAVDITFLPSSLHNDLDKLSARLNDAMGRFNAPTVVLYGTCHPQMDKFISHHNAQRIPCQNCIELLLGAEQYTQYLADGAFFLLEEWAHSWEKNIAAALGANIAARNALLRDSHQYLLCVNTPCSRDFSVQAKNIAKQTDLPIRSLDVELNYLENVFDQILMVGDRSSKGVMRNE